MNDYTIDRVKLLADYIIATKLPVRKVAKKFLISKSTVHKDVTYRLKQICYTDYLSVDQILKDNLREKHIRGGMATKNKYKTKNNNNIVVFCFVFILKFTRTI